MSTYAMKLTTFGHKEVKKSTPGFGTVKADQLASFTNLNGQTIRCSAGYLWVTLENDVMDHVVRAGQSFQIPTDGKVIVGGKGAYAVEMGTRMALAS